MGVRLDLFGLLEPNQFRQIRPVLLKLVRKLVRDWIGEDSGGDVPACLSTARSSLKIESRLLRRLEDFSDDFLVVLALGGAHSP